MKAIGDLVIGKAVIGDWDSRYRTKGKNKKKRMDTPEYFPVGHRLHILLNAQYPGEAALLGCYTPGVQYFAMVYSDERLKTKTLNFIDIKYHGPTTVICSFGLKRKARKNAHGVLVPYRYIRQHQLERSPKMTLTIIRVPTAMDGNIRNVQTAFKYLSHPIFPTRVWYST